MVGQSDRSCDGQKGTGTVPQLGPVPESECSSETATLLKLQLSSDCWCPWCLHLNLNLTVTSNLFVFFNSTHHVSLKLCATKTTYSASQWLAVLHPTDCRWTQLWIHVIHHSPSSDDEPCWNIFKVFRHQRAMPVLRNMLEMIGLIVAINCHAGYHRTSAFVALLSAVLSATWIYWPIHCFMTAMIT